MSSLVIASALAMVACGGSKYRYVSNADQLLYFKVPRSWGYFPFTEKETENRVPGDSNPLKVWHVGFDGADKPAAEHITGGDLPTAPVGEIEVWAMSTHLSESTSAVQARMRAFSKFIDFDPAYPPDELASKLTGNYEVVAFQPVVSKSGIQGSRTVVNIKARSGDWVTIDGTAYYDARTQRIYTLTQWCKADCYKASARTVSEIATSWKVNR